MNNKDNTIFLKHILDSIRKIERYLQGFDFEKFKNDEEKIDAVVRNVEIIGEASNNLTRDFVQEIRASNGEKLSLREIELFTVMQRLTWKLFGI